MKRFKRDNLVVEIYEDKVRLGQAAADLAQIYLSEAIRQRDEAVIILATGASQFEFLNALSKKNIAWNKVIAFHLDEYIGISDTHPASFRRYLRERFIDKVGIKTSFFIKGDCNDAQLECQRLETTFNKYVVDIAFTGIGENGHLAFNDPPAQFDDRVKFKVVDLHEISRKQQLGEGWFKTLADVPKQAISMTIPAILDSKSIICCVPERRKVEAVKNTLTGPISPDCPASILRQHEQCTLFLDFDSASLLDT